MYLFGYRIETGKTHFTLNDTKNRCKWTSRFSLGGGEGGERQMICIRLANHKALTMLSSNWV